jgi:hypothetical protein
MKDIRSMHIGVLEENIAAMNTKHHSLARKDAKNHKESESPVQID